VHLATVQTPAGPRAAVATLAELIDINATDPGLPASVRRLLDGGPDLLRRAAAAAARPDAVRLPVGARYLPPVPDPEKIVCIGLNYRDHAAETGAPIPRDPVLFSKFTTALIGHEAPVVLPPVSHKVDYEAELVLVVGKAGRFIPEAEAMGHLAGYMVGHDVSARDWQLEKDGKQWLAGKTFDTFAPCGPFLVTADEVPDPLALGVRLFLNGQVMQEGNTSNMIFPPARLVSYISQVVTLAPGDLIFTGTPAGVGVARKPPVWLKAGDTVEITIDHVGLLRNPVVQG
jgi:2-keto-4-pentenoate hydratase/2-oxohepta-3-ene-1,7-dioic acid hydratase in catechol pathway